MTGASLFALQNRKQKVHWPVVIIISKEFSHPVPPPPIQRLSLLLPTCPCSPSEEIQLSLRSLERYRLFRRSGRPLCSSFSSYDIPHNRVNNNPIRKPTSIALIVKESENLCWFCCTHHYKCTKSDITIQISTN